MHKQNGFMTVELIITLIVGAVLVMALNTIVNSHSYLSQRARDLVVTNAYAENKVESLRSAGYLGINTGTSDLTAELPSELKKPRSGTLTVSAYSSSIKKVHLTITYNEQGKAQTQTYTTYVGELGVGQY